jgi:V8-like Glu-specific endopeptidase
MNHDENHLLRSLARLARRLSAVIGGRPHPGAAAPRFARPAVESLEARVVPTLTPVSAGTGFPFTAIVELQMTFPDGWHAGGSGAMVDSFHVLTAGHVVYDHAHGGWARSITATPELYGNSAPFGTAQATLERTFNGWINWNNSHSGTVPGDSDMGLITLNRTIGNSTGWLAYGYDNNNADFRAGQVLNTAGYPATHGYDGRHMYFSSGPVAGLSSEGTAIEYYQNSITTYKGQSGSPVWRYTASSGSRVIYGVHVGGNESATSLNFATRITQSIFTTLQSWRQSDSTPRTAAAGHVEASAFGPSLPTSQGGMISSIQDASGDGGAAVGGEGAAAIATDAGGELNGSANAPIPLIDLLFTPATALPQENTGDPVGSSGKSAAAGQPLTRMEFASGRTHDSGEQGQNAEPTTSKCDTTSLDAEFAQHHLVAHLAECALLSDGFVLA